MAVAPPRFYTLKKQVPLTPGTGLGFVAGRGYFVRPVNAPVAHAPGAPPAAPVDPYLEQAKAIAAAMIDPQTAEAQRAIDQANRDAVAHAKAYAGVTTALGAFTQGMPEQVRAAYETAGKDISGFAQGITGEAGDNARAAAAEMARQLDAVGAPGSVEANPNYEGTVAMTGGLIPARTLAEQSATHYAQMAGLRAASGLTLEQEARKQAMADDAAVADLRAKASDLEGTRAGEVAKALLQLHDEARQQQGVDIQQQALRVQQGQLRLSQAKTVQDRAAAMTDITGTIWVARNGKAVNTGRAAPGTSGYKQTHPTVTPHTPAALQHTSIGTHAVTYDPNTGGYYFPGTQTPIPQSTLDQWAKSAQKKAAAVAPPSQQHVTLPDGTVVNYNPKTGKYIDPATGKAVDPNDHKTPGTKPLTGDALRQAHAKALNGAADARKKKMEPAAALMSLVAQGVPRWIAASAVAKVYGLPPGWSR